MNIYIPSCGRVTKQHTLLNLPPDVREQVTLVVPTFEVAMYYEMWADTCHDVIDADGADGIGEVRQWICESSVDPLVLMLDDDLTFFARRRDEPTKFTNATDADVYVMLNEMELMLSHYAHCSIAPREGANRDVNQYRYNCRALRALGYNTTIMRDNKVKFNRIPVMEDFDVALQLMELGYSSIVLNEWCQNQVGSGTEGGCSTYRTLDVQAQGAEGLKELHPKYVTVVEKTTKTAWGGATRKDVRVAWKKAYEESA